MKRLLLPTSHRPDPGSRPWHITSVTRIDLRDEHGDAPGWVLVTLMTVGLIVALWAVAGNTLTGVFLNAIARVTSVV